MAGESVIRLSVINDASPKLRVVDKDAKKLSKTVKNSNGVLNNQSKSLKAAALGWLGVGTAAKGATPGIVGAGAALATALAPIAAFTSGVALLTSAVTLFAKQDEATAALKTLKVNTDELVPSLLQVSNELDNQFSQLELTVAAYDVASAGFTDAADAAEVLYASSLAARAGMADLATTGDAVTTVLNAWKMSASDAEMVADKMQQTVADGKIQISQYAANIGKVATVASMVGVPLDEVNAAIALSTKNGVKAEVAFTGMMTALLRLTGEAGGQKLKALGIDISAATLESEGLAANLEKLADLDIKALEQIFGQEAIQTMGPVLANLKEYNQLLENQANSANRARDAANDQAQTIGGAWKKLTTVLSNAFTQQTEMQAATIHLINLATSGIKLIGGLLEPVVWLLNKILWLVNKTIEGIQHLYNIAPDWAKQFMNPGAGLDPRKERPTDKPPKKDPKKDPAIDSLNKQIDLTKTLNEEFKKVGETISQNLAEGVKGLIKGTQTLGEMLANTANRIADMLLDIGISAAFKGLGFPGFAAGGRPPVGKPSIVGEKGPELFVPRQAGTIIPNNQLGGGSTSVVVNVDASGSAVQGDGGQAEELGSMLAAAVQAELVNQQRPGGLLAGTR